MENTNDLPFLNLGCGNVLLPCEKPFHHALLPDDLYEYPHWVNVDKDEIAGAEQLDIFRYPWKWKDNSFGGAVLTHLVEHIPHEFRQTMLEGKDRFPSGDSSAAGDARFFARVAFLQGLGDGFYAFFSELARVLVDGAVVHVLVPYALSTGGMQDPTHRRYMMPESFSYLIPNADAPFKLADVGNWEVNAGISWGLTAYGAQMMQDMAQAEISPEQANDHLMRAIQVQFNVANEFYIKLRVRK